MNHECIKCKTRYSSKEEEAYLCASCLQEKSAIAAQVDAKFANKPRSHPKSGMQQYEENSVTVNGLKLMKYTP